MRFGSLFAGIGGLDLGFEAAGMECAWQVEWDDYCQRVLGKHWPGVPRFGDIRDCGGHNLAPVDLICGGFPCQPVSTAGKRGGVDDERWLWPEFHRIICELRPRWVVGENVPGLLSANSGRAMGEVLGDLAACGYDAVWDVFPAGGPGGVGAPHRRERIFIVAHTNDIGSQKRHPERGEPASEGETDYVMPRGSVVAHASGQREGPRAGGGRDGGGRQFVEGARARGDVDDGGDALAYAISPRREGEGDCTLNAGEARVGGNGVSIGGWWQVEPDVGRVANGVSSRVDRLKCLGNAVVPQVAEEVGRMIMEYN